MIAGGLRSDELVIDNFAGGGGTSVGLEWALGRSPDVAINHNAEAVALHKANHPDTLHLCQSVWKADPRDVVTQASLRRGSKTPLPVGLAWFSPDCTHFSKAKGSKPVKKHVRDLAWVVVHWARLVKPRIERVMLAALYCASQEWAIGTVIWASRTKPDWNLDHEMVVCVQHEVGDYRLDFALFGTFGRNQFQFAIECDGHDFHERTKEQAARDKRRDRWLQANGFSVLRFTGSEIWRDPAAAAAEAFEVMGRQIVDACARAA